MMRRLLYGLILVAFFLFAHRFVLADTIEDIGRQIEEVTRELESSRKATKPLEENLQKIETDLSNIERNIAQLSNDIQEKGRDIQKSEEDLVQQQDVLSERVRKYYKESRDYLTNIIGLFLNQGLSEGTRLYFYQQQGINSDRAQILKIALFIRTLEEKKADLEYRKKQLALYTKSLGEQKAFFAQEVGKAKNYQAELERRIAQLSTQQQQLVAQKLSGLNLPSSLGAGPLYCTDDRKLNPGFSPAYAFYTFGIPHRVGMNQYGSLGRANAGQNYQQILESYFLNFSLEKRDNITINVQGYGSMPLEDYLLGIYEMPESWPLQALKAQVVAARSYVLSYTNNGAREICTTQACQVYKGGNKGGNWEVAVRETAGEVMVSGGQVVTAWYASTAGGYTFNSSDVWGGSSKPWTRRSQDVSGSINSIQDLFSNAYDRDSPCFYAAQGYRNEYDKSAWLKPEEVADIVNTILLSRKDSSTQEHLYQVDKAHPYGGEVWSVERVKEELKNRGTTPFNTVSNISMGFDLGNGITTNISISGDGGSVNFDGGEFKNFFNLRAPANIQIVGPLYNIERR